MNLAELIKYLNSLHELIISTNNYETKREAVLKFNNYIFDFDGVAVNDEVDGKVYKFAMESEYYEPDPQIRKEDSIFFNDQQFINKIELLLKELKNISDNSK